MTRAIQANPNGLTVTEIALRDETGIRMIYRDLEALQAAGFRYPCHARAQSTPKEIFRLLFFFLDIFLAASHSIRKIITEFSAIPSLRSLRLCGRWLDEFNGLPEEVTQSRKARREGNIRAFRI